MTDPPAWLFVGQNLLIAAGHAGVALVVGVKLRRQDTLSAWAVAVLLAWWVSGSAVHALATVDVAAARWLGNVRVPIVFGDMFAWYHVARALRRGKERAEAESARKDRTIAALRAALADLHRHDHDSARGRLRAALSDLTPVTPGGAA